MVSSLPGLSSSNILRQKFPLASLHRTSHFNFCTVDSVALQKERNGQETGDTELGFRNKIGDR
jgi:hypothetical protein